MLKRILLSIINSSVCSLILSKLEASANSNRDFLRVLTYHRVDYRDANPQLSPAILSAEPEDFKTQMRFVAEHYHPVSIYEVLDAIDGNSQLPKKSILITFDDAYHDFADHAWPILQCFKIPVLLFVPTGFPDNPERKLWWDRLYHTMKNMSDRSIVLDGKRFDLDTEKQQKLAFKALRNKIKSMPHYEAMEWVDHFCKENETSSMEDNYIKSWTKLNDLSQDGVTLAAHSVSHPLLNRIPLEQAIKEANDSRHQLENHVGEVPPVFAYPSGGANSIIADKLAASGFKLAFTTQRGLNDLNTANPLLLRRINIGSNTSINVMRSQLLDISILLNRFLS
jgi:peptidoglycan/xylan/chitin deacetylase (PgdA/CDA1 family)